VTEIVGGSLKAGMQVITEALGKQHEPGGANSL